MKLKKYSVALLCFALAFATAGCTGDFEERNTNPEEGSHHVEYDDYLFSAFRQMCRNMVPSYQVIGSEEYGSGSYQIIQDLAGNIFSGYSGAINSGFTANNLYNITASSWYNAMFDDSYTRVISAYNTLTPQREEFPERVALADIVKVATMSRVTDTYGPIPYLSIGESFIQSEYDAQETVYGKFFEELDSAIDVLTDFATAQSGSTLLQRFDDVFAGDVTKWIKFANTLRLRLALRVVYADPALAEAQARAAVQNPIGLMASATDAARLNRQTGAAWENPLYIIQYNFNDSRIGATIEAYMNGYNDPRLPRYFVEGSDGAYHGVRNGISLTSSYGSSTLLSKINATNEDPILWMAPAEAYFLLAECAVREWSWVPDTAKNYYEKGIEVAFATAGASGYAAYIANNTAYPVSYTDAVSGVTATFPNVPTVAWDASASFEVQLERVITQKYIAMFPDGQEAWSEFRRTGYPKVLPVLVNNSGGAINTTQQIRRLNFPATEYQTNGEAVANAVQTLISESFSDSPADNGGTRVWWDKNPNF